MDVRTSGRVVPGHPGSASHAQKARVERKVKARLRFRHSVSSRHHNSSHMASPSIHAPRSTLGRTCARRSSRRPTRTPSDPRRTTCCRRCHDPGILDTRRNRCDERRAARESLETQHAEPSGAAEFFLAEILEHRAAMVQGLFQRSGRLRPDSGAPEPSAFWKCWAGDDQGQCVALRGHRLLESFGAPPLLKRLQQKNPGSLSTLLCGPCALSVKPMASHIMRTQTRSYHTSISSGARAILGVVWNANSGLSYCRRPLNCDAHLIVIDSSDRAPEDTPKQ